MPRRLAIQNPVWTVQIVQGHVYVGKSEKEGIENNLNVIKWFEGDDAEIKAKAYAYDFMVATELPQHSFPSP